jgi:type IV pilus assembly protein PilZ
MPFLHGGGLFIPTNRSYKLGDEVFMLLQLPDDPAKLKVVGHVAWITPVTQGNRPQGIGVRFSEKDGGIEVRNKIEGMLVGALKSSRPTHTM